MIRFFYKTVLSLITGVFFSVHSSLPSGTQVHCSGSPVLSHVPLSHGPSLWFRRLSLVGTTNVFVYRAYVQFSDLVRSRLDTYVTVCAHSPGHGVPVPRKESTPFCPWPDRGGSGVVSLVTSRFMDRLFRFQIHFFVPLPEKRNTKPPSLPDFPVCHFIYKIFSVL